MSTDWTVYCSACKVGTHLGQRFTSGPCFGFGSRDKQGRDDAADFINEHLSHGPLTVNGADAVPDDIVVSWPKQLLPITRPDPPITVRGLWTCLDVEMAEGHGSHLITFGPDKFNWHYVGHFMGYSGTDRGPVLELSPADDEDGA